MQKEYIDREPILKDIEEKLNVARQRINITGGGSGKMLWEGIGRGIIYYSKKLLAAPAADVVEVVRCKYCKYCIPATADGAEYELCIVDNDVFPVSVQKQHFCSRGKGKEE